MRILSSDCLLTALTRVQVLDIVPKGGSALEIGVNRGEFAKKILERTAPHVLHLVDPWPTDQSDAYVSAYNVKYDMEATYRSVLDTFDQQIGAGEVAVHRSYSKDCLSAFPEAGLDFIYVDAMHSYEGCLEDLVSYSSKLKSTGILMGHDFSNTSTGRRKHFGVVRAVNEFLQRSDFMPVMVTIENAPSYVLTRHHATRDMLITAALTKGPGVLAGFSRIAELQQITVPLKSNRKIELMRL